MIDNIRFWKGSTTIGSALALFESSARDWSLVYFQPERPVLEGELNLLQQATNRRLRDLLRGIYPAGGVLKDLAPGATGVANELRVHTQNQPFFAILDGIMKPVYAYDDPPGGGATVGGNRVTLPAYTSGTYDELVYLEVWFEEVMGTEGGSGDLGTASVSVPQWGMVANFNFNNDIKVGVVPLSETSRRVQLRGQIKTVAGDSLTGVLARGVSGFGYGLVAGTNYYRAGAGTQQSGESLNAVDGYSYALPLVRVNRKSSVIQSSDIFLATDVIPTGSDVSADIVALENTTITPGSGLSGGGELKNGNIDLAVVSTDSRTSSSATTMLQAKGMNDHNASGDHDSRYHTKTELASSGAGGAQIHFDRLQLGSLDGAKLASQSVNQHKTTFFPRIRMEIGVVNANGTPATSFPNNWSSIRNDTGVYTITRPITGLGINVIITPQAAGGGPFLPHIREITGTTIVVNMYNLAGSLTDCAFHFHYVI